MREIGPTFHDTKEDFPISHDFNLEIVEDLNQMVKQTKDIPGALLDLRQELKDTGSTNITISDKIDLERRYCVLKAYHPQLKSNFVFKKLTPNHDSFKQDIINERAIYEKFLPYFQLEVLRKQHPDLEKRVGFSVMAAKSGTEKYPSLLISYEEGKQCGNIGQVELNTITSQDTETIIDLIDAWQDVPVEEIKELMPEYESVESSNASSCFSQHQQRLETHSDKLKRMVTLIGEDGENYINKMQKILVENEEFLKSGKEVFTNQDFNPSNFIKNKEGKLIFFDYERVKILTNRAAAFSPTIATLHKDYQRQQEAIAYLDQKQKDKLSPEDFQRFKKEQLLDFIFYRSFIYCSTRRLTEIESSLGNKDSWDEEQKEQYQYISDCARMLKNAIDLGQVWKK